MNVCKSVQVFKLADLQPSYRRVIKRDFDQLDFAKSEIIVFLPARGVLVEKLKSTSSKSIMSTRWLGEYK